MASKPFLLKLPLDLHATLKALSKTKGQPMAWLMVTATRQYLDDTRIYLDVPVEAMAKLRGLCVAQGKTLNAVVNDTIAKGLA